MKLHIADMLRAQSAEHISFHTPGHKHAGGDITELSYSDNLYSPQGVIKRAEEDAAKILGAHSSFFLTDGSTSGVFSMIYAVKAAGGERLAASEFSHPSVFHACKALGMKIVPIPQAVRWGIPMQPDEKEVAKALQRADALLLTSPDYYGYFPPLAAAKELCRTQKKPLLCDGAHGSHLHFCERYAGKFADMWVDGVHKSLPAMTQGAVVSAKENWAAQLGEAVRVFRTTSPAYPILASVEYAVKYPRNLVIEEASEAFKRGHGCLINDDWSKILVPFGEKSSLAQAALEKNNIYPEFNDGNFLMFYLSPCTKKEELGTLGALLDGLPRGEVGEDAPQGGIPIYREGL